MLTLPEYPCVADVWDVLCAEKRPIVVYGMGDGADKLLARFEMLGIAVADFFASDGFVRGQIFHGKRVKSLAEIKETYPDFLVVLAFASNKPDVIAMLTELDKTVDMVAPDMPVAGDAYFDRAFYNAHYSEIEKAYHLFADEASKNCFAAVLHYRLTGRICYLIESEDAFCTKDALYALLPCASIHSVCDAGAYTGDTLREMMRYFPSLSFALAIEPDPRSFRKLSAFAEENNAFPIRAICAAAWSEVGRGSLKKQANRNSHLTFFGEEDTSLVSIDAAVAESDVPMDFIKYDVEGAEKNALIGSAGTVRKFAPSMLVSLYHKSEDVFYLPIYLAAEYPYYRFYLRRLYCLPAWELDLIMIPEERHV